jgi:hypothetical protein
MRRLLLVASALALVATAPAAAGSGPSVSPDAKRVPAGEKYLLEGSGWSLAPGCETAVEVSRRLGHGVPVGSAEIAEDGTFTFMRRIPRRAAAGSRIVLDVTQFCTSGTDRVGVTRTVVIRVMRRAHTCPGTIAVNGRAYILETWGGLGCASAKAIGPYLDAHIAPDGYDCEMTDPRLGYHAACVIQVAPRQRVTARRIREV